MLDSFGQLSVLVFAVDLETKPRSRSSQMRALYGLTPTERQISDHLAAGKEIKEAAICVGVTLETARFHLKRIFAKTGTHRQVDLMRLMLSLPGQNH